MFIGGEVANEGDRSQKLEFVSSPIFVWRVLFLIALPCVDGRKMLREQ